MDIKVSVIIPVYNSERFLKDTVESVLNQSLKEIEIIFVDDGSSDGSLKVLRDYQERDKRIKVLEQKNKFAGVARNRGMQNAQGKYIIFLDSDDFFVPDMLYNCYHYAEKTSAEIVMYGFYEYDDILKRSTAIYHPRFPEGVFSASDLGTKIYEMCLPCPWNKFFLRSFVLENKIEFQVTRKCNDTLFTRIAVSCASRMIYIRERYVYYRVNNGASLQGNGNKGTECFLQAGMAIKKELENRGLYHGELREAYLKEAEILIVNALSSVTDKNEFNMFYQAARDNMIGNLFDSEKDFENNIVIRKLYLSNGAESFAWELRLSAIKEIKELKQQINTDYVSKASMDYRIGHIFMKLPRKAMKILSRVLSGRGR